MDSQQLNTNQAPKSSRSNTNNPFSNNKIAYISLIEELDILLRNLDYKNIELLKACFMSFYEDYNHIINNIIKTSQSDIIINFGINNFISKIFIEEALKSNHKKLESFEIEKVYLNANIHSTEDYILKKICKALDLNPERNGFDGAREEIEEYYKNYRKNRQNKFLVLVFENIEHLFFKKKQTLFYTLLEIVNLSSNILFCGITSNFNIMDLMEKRVRSRFSQKTINIQLKEDELVFFALQDFFYSMANKNKIPENNPFLDSLGDSFHDGEMKNGMKINVNSLSNVKNGNRMDVVDTQAEKANIDLFSKASNFMNNQNLLRDFYKLFLKENKNFNMLIKDKIEMGCGIKEIITQFKYLLTIFLVKIKERISKEPKLFIDSAEIESVLEISFKQYFDETESSYRNMLCNFPKLHITILVCLCRCIRIHKEKIGINMIYHEYLTYVTNQNIRTKLDILIIKKILEELANSNLIHIKSDEKYLNLYELKLPYSETVDLLKELNFKKFKNMDSTLQGFLEHRNN